MPLPMKRLPLLLILVLSTLLPSSQAASGNARLELPFTFSAEETVPPKPGDSIRVCTWNIEWFPAGQRDSQEKNVNWQVAAVAEILNEVQPDILLTQETRNLQRLRQLNRNLNPPGFSHLASTLFYQENTPDNLDDRVRQECGLMSRFAWSEIEEIDFEPLRGKNLPTRGWLFTSFELKGARFAIYNGHLKSNYGAHDEKKRQSNIEKRTAAIEQLQQDLYRRMLDPYRDRIIVCGDFNSDFFSPAFSDEELFEEMEDLGFHHTFPTALPERRITVPAREGEPWADATFDYIFLSSAWGQDMAEATVLPRGASKRIDVYGGDEVGLASDHYPVFIDLPLLN